MKNSLLVIGFIIFVFSGCSENRNDLQSYQTIPKKLTEKDIEIKTSLHANLKNGELTLFMKVKNNSENTIIVDYQFCCISVDDDRVVLAEPRQAYKARLVPGAKENYEIVYHPINSMELFYNAGYFGDLLPKYFLKTDFIKNEEDHQLLESTISFEMQENIFRDYTNTYGQNDKIQLFELSLNRDSFLSDHKEFLEKLVPVASKSSKSESDSLLKNIILISNSDIIIENRVFKFAGYKQGDTLYMNMGILNMGLNKLKVRLDTFCLNALGQNYFPTTIQSEYFSYNQMVDSTFTLKQGARFNFFLKYSIPAKFDAFELNMDWLQIQNLTGESNGSSFSKLFGKGLFFKGSSDE